MVVATKAIVFSAIKYAEADLIVGCFTEAAGMKSYLLHRVLKAKKSKLKASLFQPLTQLDLIAEHKNKGTLEYIKEAKINYPYQTLHTDVVKGGMVMFLAEMLKNSIREEEPNAGLYVFLESMLQWLDSNEAIANFHIYFLLQLSRYLGFYPDDTHLSKPYFNLEEGVFQETPTAQHCLAGEAVENFKHFFPIGLDTLHTLSLTKTQRKDVLMLVLAYYRFHLHGFKIPKSLAVLNQLFA